ncbi:polyprenyl synthetase family protein [Streptomyces sp. MSC1_001]|uniref:polyprenyl synthetase family protein n=1 Tax=Streptomyces sp. MSC1_001 TaxID=2909263 RepID=UPI00202FFE8D|nr:polyprenyl synthetase family protein [Streptomyces sp. MSC1_001]
MTRTAPAHPATSARDDLGALLAQVESGLRAFLSQERFRWSRADGRGSEPALAVAELVGAGGKRLRPRFLLSGYLAAGGEPGEAPVRAAMALELLHVSALIHDDVMDDADRRRTRPTVHARHAEIHRDREWFGEPRRYGESVAILAGDLAWAYADYLMAGTSPAVAREWFDLKSELIAGQAMDVTAAAELTPDAELARHIALVKSGRYTVHRPLALGALLAGRPDLAAAFQPYGEALGEAFQLRDDLIDAFGDGAVSGKPVRQDFGRGKMTLLLALAMRSDGRIRALVERGEAELLRERLSGTAVHARIEARIEQLVERACASLAAADLPPEWRRELTSTASSAAYREA